MSIPEFLWRLFGLHTLIGKIFFVLIVLIGAAFYFRILPFKNDCNRVTLVGALVDKKSKKALRDVTVRLGGTNTEDHFLANGKFTVEGVVLPKSKIISLSVEFQDGARATIDDFDLNNDTKYPIENCIIDLQEVLVETNKMDGIGSPGEKKRTPEGEPTQPVISGGPTNQDAPPESLSISDYFHKGADADVAIVVTGKNDGKSNLKGLIAKEFKSHGLTTTFSLFKPSFLTKFSNKIEQDDVTALKNSGLGNHIACLCFVRVNDIDYKKNQETINSESFGFANTEGSYEVKVFTLKNNDVDPFAITETGAGANQARALESLEEKFMLKFINQNIFYQSCKR